MYELENEESKNKLDISKNYRNKKIEEYDLNKSKNGSEIKKLINDQGS